MDQKYIQKLESRIGELESSVRELKRLLYYRVTYSGTGVSYDDQVLTVNNVIDLLGLPCHIIYDKAMSGEIPSFKIGKRYRFSRKKVLEWFENGIDKAVILMSL